MFTKILKNIFGDKHSKLLKELTPVVDEINEEYAKLQNLTDEELKAKTNQLKEKIALDTKELREEIDSLKNKLTLDSLEDNHQAVNTRLDELNRELDDRYEDVLDEILPEAFAIVKDTCRRLVGQSWDAAGYKITWDMIPYDVQLIGGIVLHQGKIAEMATGEGKTLVATLPIYLNSLTGRGVHVVTVNDYLAKRDSEWMGKIFEFHGLTIGNILSSMDPEQRKISYNSDITYGTNNEFGFDYLRDNMAVRQEDCVQRVHNYTIVDEVDSVLIDEARTPLIISGPVGSPDHKFYEMKPKVDLIFKKQAQLVSSIVAEAERDLSNPDGVDEEKVGLALLRASRGFPKNNRLMKLFSEPYNKRLMPKIRNGIFA